jgi:uncharacterized protein YdeI (BOF family)
LKQSNCPQGLQIIHRVWGKKVQAKEIAKYAVVFVAGAFAVLGVIGLNSLMQPQNASPEPVASAELQTSSDDSITENEPDSANDTNAKETTATPSKPSESPSPVSNPTFTSKPVDGVSSIGGLVRNTMVTIEGTVTRASEEDEFIIRDSTGSVQVYTGRTFFTVNVGDVVSVTGLVDESAQLEVYADEITFEDGTVIKVRHWR